MYIPALTAASLVSCPDCSGLVSSRAVMCPRCGCPGEAIAVAGKDASRALTGAQLEAVCDGVDSVALPMCMDGQVFAVLPLEHVLGCGKIKLGLHGRDIEWLTAELSVEAPVVRFRLAETNLHCWAEGRGPVFEGKKLESMGCEVSGVRSPMISTNAHLVTRLRWDVLQPKQMRNHGLQLLRLLKGESHDPLPMRTHPYFKRLESERKGDPE